METSLKLGTYNYRFGLIAAIVSMVFSLMIYFFDFQNNTIIKIIPIIIPTLASLMAILKFKENHKNKITLKVAVKISIGVFLICAILYQFYLVVFLKFTSHETNSISTDFFNSLPPVLIKSIVLGILVGITTGIFTKKS
ncbi:MAG: DUF4199 family protein [Bacteroidetes bacterium]|nr:DUF4199 family protein [Bacteroidota bacterium]